MIAKSAMLGRRIVLGATLSGCFLTGLVCGGDASPVPPPNPATPPSPATPPVPVGPALPPNSATPPAPVRSGPVPMPVPPRGPRLAPQMPAAPETPADIKDMTNSSYLLDLAQVHLRYNALDRAEELLTKALAGVKSPDEKARVSFQLGTLHQMKRDWKSASANFEDALASVTNPSQRAQYAVSLADAYTQSGELEKAEKTLSAIAGLGANEAPKPEEAWVRNMAWQRLVTVWQRQEGKLDKVTAELESDLTKDPSNQVVLERLAELYSGVKRDPKKAITILEKVAEKKPSDASTMTRLASMYQEDKQYDKAIAIHQKLATNDPRGMGQYSHLQIAQIMLQAGKKDEAIAWVKEHLAKDSAPGSISMVEMFYEQAGMLQEAEDSLSKMAEQAQSQPQKADYLLREADVARRRKDYAKSEKEIRGVLEKFKDEKMIMSRANSALVRLYEEQGRMGELKVQK